VAKVEMPEKLLTQIWKRQLIDAGKLVSESGDTFRVINPGRENRDSGPDFIDAIVSNSRGEVLRGDIELHSKARDWRNHGHDRDPNYDRVILHVVWDGVGEAVRSSGKKIPTLSLSNCLDYSLDDVRYQIQLPVVPAETCFYARRRLSDREVGRLLDEAGDERFRIKADCFAARLRSDPPSQILYQGIMGALGYAKNRENFEELACRLPLAVFEDICRDKPAGERVVTLQALLLGASRR
jgi:hypothetical protein